MDHFTPAILIGIYDHGGTIGSVVASLEGLGLPFQIVDDGSHDETRRVLLDLAGSNPRIALARLPRNRGRGAALVHGLELLRARGVTHAVVVDADGQHDPGDVPAFLAAARRRPDALILGRPVFGADAPLARLLGRRLSQFWVAVETLSRDIADPLCGFRCYPVRRTLDVVHGARVGCRMDFDPEIAVRLHWHGARIVNVATRVAYPQGGISHFRMLRDNARISWMHTRLVLGMLPRLPRLLSRRLARASPEQERGT